MAVILELNNAINRWTRFMRARFLIVLLSATGLLAACAAPADGTALAQRNSFVGFKDFSSFTKSPGSAPGEIILTSPEIASPVAWDECVLSWNVGSGVYLKAEARGVYPDHSTKYYTLGLWSDDTSHQPRESVNKQKDADGTVETDTLVLSRHGAKLQVRITLGGPDAGNAAQLKFLGVSFCDSRTKVTSHTSNRAVWGHSLPVPERIQSGYEGAGGWCSPASLSMVLAYWGDTLHRPELDHTVPEVAAAIKDPSLDGTGNWPFNTAYAGAFTGMRAYVTRLDDISELEDWIAAGIPPIISVSSYLTHDLHIGQDNGHLIVCVGFTKKGDLIANDPGISVRLGERPLRVYKRQKAIDAWNKSKNTVYLVYPETNAIPKAPFGHWDQSK
ncbi:MAG: Peptidase like family [Pedosphaera sp.]|nr:Peptidase like family [Pedosphaera sp.]